MRTTTTPPALESLSLDHLAKVSGGCKKKCPPPPPPPQPQGGESISTDVSISYQ